MSLVGKARVLIVDDNSYNVSLLTELIAENGYDPVCAFNGKTALELVALEKPDLILLDVKMPEMNGYEVCQRLKNDPTTAEIPVIFITVQSDVEDVIKGFTAGAVDYVNKPFNILELQMRIKTHLELKQARDALKINNAELATTNRELIRANEIIRAQNEQLKAVAGELERLSITDALTELFNRRYGLAKLEEEVRRFKRHQKPFSVIIADIDDFKQVNDRYGHDCGDYVLKMISRCLVTSVRDLDTVCRWGGEEFLILLPETPLGGARVLAERIKSNLQTNQMVYQAIPLTTTVTFGIAAYTREEPSDTTLKKADQALYEGKKCGKNCIVISS